jgi:predicted membrane channel-forming protein YqfA (hemolysin III family)
MAGCFTRWAASPTDSGARIRGPRWFGFHEVFHACIVAAFACQYVAVSILVCHTA